MLSHEIKECLSQVLFDLENSIDLLEEFKDQEFRINNWYHKLNEIYEEITMKYEQ